MEAPKSRSAEELPQIKALRHQSHNHPARRRSSQALRGEHAHEEQLELELKFDVLEADARRLMEGLTPIGRPRDRAQRTVYFDTPETLLRRNGLALRIRDDGAGHVQTIKSKSTGGALGRGEWETPVADFVLNPAAFDRTPLDALLKRADVEALAPVFEVRVKRARRLVAFGGAQVEIVFDRGEAKAGVASTPIREIELELKSGPTSALFDLAAELGRAAPMHLSFVSKAERGFALVDRAKGCAAPDKADFAEDAAADHAFAAIAMTALAQMADGARRLRVRPDAEALHETRVAVRRLRSAISLFGPMLADDRCEAIKTALKAFAGELNAARNFDVFIAETLDPFARARADASGVEALTAAAAARRDEAHARAAQAAGSAGFREMMLETARWVELGAWRDNPAQQALCERTIGQACAQLQAHRLKKLLDAGPSLKAMTPDARHRLRIKTKKLRYAADYFAPLYDGEKAGRHAAMRGVLTVLQNELGKLNDIETAQALAADVLAPDGSRKRDVWLAYAAGLAIGERLAGETKVLKAAQKAYAKLRARKGHDWRP